MMKRIFSLTLVVLLMLSFSACHYSKSGDILEPVDYYYPRKTTSFVYGSDEGIITAEVREASGHIGDLYYLLTMYLRGPQNKDLYSPFPAGCILEEVYKKDDTLYIRFSAEFAQLQNLDLTIACASLAKTCQPLTGLPRISIESISGENHVHMIMDANSLLLSDQSAFESTKATE